MTLALFLAAIRRHPFAIALSGLFLAISASLIALPVPIVLGVWAAAAIVSLEAWYAIEPFVLERFGGYRAPSHAESELLNRVLASSRLQPLISTDPGFVLVRGMRCLIVGRDVLDLFEARALSGALHQTALPAHRADLAGVAIAWLAGLPLLAAWLVSRGCTVLGRFLGIVLGESLVLPLVLWRDGFLAWSARVFGAMIAALLAASLLSDGYAAAGFELAVAWLAVPAIQALLAWESRRVEAATDRETVDAGFGSQLLEAIELLIVAEPRITQEGLLRAFTRPGGRLIERSNRIRRLLSSS